MSGRLTDTVERIEGVFIWKEPSDPRNYNDWPRLPACFIFNLFEAEGGSGPSGISYNGIYLLLLRNDKVKTSWVMRVHLSEIAA